MLRCTLFTLAAALLSFAAAAPYTGKDRSYLTRRDGKTFNVFEHGATGAKIEFVNNSGICETTPGVNQYSGYLSVGNNMNMFFWFFEARNNPSTAPLTAWFNGGPGCSSMIGLFQEHGPCHFENGSNTPSLNPNSWNEYSNMLYIDQPIGVGFSYGTDDVTSTVTAAPYVWKLLQAFYTKFPQYESRDFGLMTESYGGHYGPEFASYILNQNKGISNGSVQGENINIVALGINNGWFDPIIQYKAYIDFSANNTYKQLISASQASSYESTYENECLPALQQCSSLTSSNDACTNAQSVCAQDIQSPLSEAGDFDVYDVRAPSNDPNPPETYATYLADKTVMNAIGAQSTYQECPDAPYNKFSSTGDDSRSFLPTLSNLVSSNSNITFLLWSGDADWICNWMGNLGVADAVEFSGQSEFQSKTLENYTVNGVARGTFKTVDNFSFMRVFEAGHEVPYYQPETALQVFKQVMQGTGLKGT